MTSLEQLGLFCASESPSEKGQEKTLPQKMVRLDLSLSPNTSDENIENFVTSIGNNLKKLDDDAKIKRSTPADQRPWFEQSFVALDVETTGLHASSNRVIELAIVPFNMPERTEMFSELFNIGEALPSEIIKITGINDEMLEGKPSFKDKASECLKMFEGASFILAYNAKFDRPFIESELARVDATLPDIPWVDPYVFVCEIDKYKKGKKLINAAARWGVELENAHRATDDAKAAGDLMLKMADKINQPCLKQLLTRQKINQWRNEHALAEYRKANAWSINR